MKNTLGQELFKKKSASKFMKKLTKSLVVDTKSRTARRAWPLHKTPLLNKEDLNSKISINNGYSFGEPYEAHNCTVSAGNTIFIH